MIYGYCRVSTRKQSIERQERNILAAYPDGVIVREVYTGTRSDRPEWSKIMRQVERGSVDRIVFDSVSRMSRDAQEGFETYKSMLSKGVALTFLKEPQIDTETYQAAAESQISIAGTGDAATDELMDSITAALNRYILRLAEKQIQLAFEQAEKAVQDLHQRTREGIETARMQGKQIGRQQGRRYRTKKEMEAKKLIRKNSKAFDGMNSDDEVIKIAGISRNTYYKYKKEMLTGMGDEKICSIQ